MKNSTIIILAAFAALSSAACSKLQEPEAERYETGEKCSLSLAFSGGVGTRATGQTGAKESMIQNVQVFVFRAGAGLTAGSSTPASRRALARL